MNKEIKIGFVSVVTIAVLLIGVNYLKGINLFDNNRTIYAIYTNIGGLQEGSGVSVNGFKIGIVKNISLLADENYDLMVTGRDSIKLNGILTGVAGGDNCGTSGPIGDYFGNLTDAQIKLINGFGL